MLRLDKEQYFKIWLNSARTDGTQINDHTLRLAQSAFNYGWSIYQKKNKLVIAQNHYYQEKSTKDKIIVCAVATDKNKINHVLYTYVESAVLHIVSEDEFNADFVHIDDERNRIICTYCGYYLSGCYCNNEH
ncbi:MAG: hypothetical protein [Bacteriophage sp.]|nr:MAG: hypothetical protein [Bacteriophage sp.]